MDTETASAGIQLLVRAALDDIAAGLDAQAVARKAMERRSRVTIYVLLDTLTYLQRGGRIGRAQAMLGSLLNVKPLLTVQDGEVAPKARVRSRDRASRRSSSCCVTSCRCAGSPPSIAAPRARCHCCRSS